MGRISRISSVLLVWKTLICWNDCVFSLKHVQFYLVTHTCQKWVVVLFIPLIPIPERDQAFIIHPTCSVILSWFFSPLTHDPLAPHELWWSFRNVEIAFNVFNWLQTFQTKFSIHVISVKNRGQEKRMSTLLLRNLISDDFLLVHHCKLPF